MTISKNIGQIIGLFCLQVLYGYMDICDIQSLPGNESKGSSNYVLNDASD